MCMCTCMCMHTTHSACGVCLLARCVFTPRRRGAASNPNPNPNPNPNQVRLHGGEVLPADLLIYATGFSSMENFVAQLVSPAVAERVGRVWGYGSGAPKDPGPFVGELRNMWRPTAVDGLWFMGGNLAQARHYSRLVALQLAARYDGLPTPVCEAVDGRLTRRT